MYLHVVLVFFFSRSLWLFLIEVGLGLLIELVHTSPLCFLSVSFLTQFGYLECYSVHLPQQQENDCTEYVSPLPSTHSLPDPTVPWEVAACFFEIYLEGVLRQCHLFNVLDSQPLYACHDICIEKDRIA